MKGVGWSEPSPTPFCERNGSKEKSAEQRGRGRGVEEKRGQVQRRLKPMLPELDRSEDVGLSLVREGGREDGRKGSGWSRENDGGGWQVQQTSTGRRLHTCCAYPCHAFSYCVCVVQALFFQAWSLAARLCTEKTKGAAMPSLSTSVCHWRGGSMFMLVMFFFV